MNSSNLIKILVVLLLLVSNFGFSQNTEFYQKVKADTVTNLGIFDAIPESLVALKYPKTYTDTVSTVVVTKYAQTLKVTAIVKGKVNYTWELMSLPIKENGPMTTNNVAVKVAKKEPQDVKFYDGFKDITSEILHVYPTNQ